MTLSERVLNNIYKPLKMLTSKYASGLSRAKLHNQLLRLVKADYSLKLVTASQRAMPNTSFTDPE